VYSEKWGLYKVLGQTKDDAVGEAFDKVARMMGLPYPGGPQISILANEARMGKTQTSTIPVLPRPMLRTNDFDFSFSGLKTAVLYLVKKLGDISEDQRKEIAREFEDAIVEVLVAKTKRALEEYNAKTLIVGGGVIANKKIREEILNLKKDFPDISIFLPTRDLSTDNAVMIAMASYIRYSLAKDRFTPETTLRAQGNLSLE
jgi:N6-L-threonylcarbamoyladenine synthase